MLRVVFRRGSERQDFLPPHHIHSVRSRRRLRRNGGARGADAPQQLRVRRRRRIRACRRRHDRAYHRVRIRRHERFPLRSNTLRRGANLRRHVRLLVPGRLRPLRGRRSGTCGGVRPCRRRNAGRKHAAGRQIHRLAAHTYRHGGSGNADHSRRNAQDRFRRDGQDHLPQTRRSDRHHGRQREDTADACGHAHQQDERRARHSYPLGRNGHRDERVHSLRGRRVCADGGRLLHSVQSLRRVPCGTAKI